MLYIYHIVPYNSTISPYHPIPYPKPLITSLPSYLSYISFLASIPSFPSFPKLSQPSLLAPFPACSLAACLSASYLNHFPQIHLLCPQLHRKQLGDKGGEVVQCICPPITSPYQSLYKEKMGEGQVPLTSQTEVTLLPHPQSPNTYQNWEIS